MISVRRTFNYTADKGIYTDNTKTKKLQHSLKFPLVVMDLLCAYNTEQDEEREKLGSKWNDEPNWTNPKYDSASDFFVFYPGKSAFG